MMEWALKDRGAGARGPPNSPGALESARPIYQWNPDASHLDLPFGVQEYTRIGFGR